MPETPATRTSSAAVASLVLGILSIPLNSWFFLGSLLGILAIVMGFLALSQIKAGRGHGRSLALAGIITGAVGILVGMACGIFLLGFSK